MGNNTMKKTLLIVFIAALGAGAVAADADDGQKNQAAAAPASRSHPEDFDFFAIRASICFSRKNIIILTLEDYLGGSFGPWKKLTTVDPGMCCFRILDEVFDSSFATCRNNSTASYSGCEFRIR